MRTPVCLSLAVLLGACRGPTTEPKAVRAESASDSASSQAITVGSRVPAFTRDRLDGKGRIDVPRGTVTIVAFWALSWGGQLAIPKYEKLHEEYGARGVELVVVSRDDEELAKALPEALSKYHATFPVVWDEGDALVDLFRPTNIMAAYVIDREGVVQLVESGGKESWPAASAAVEAKVRDLLAAR